jgi:hypothetical protein
MNALCKIVSYSLNLYTSPATLKPDTNSLEKSACMASSNVGKKKTYLGLHEKYFCQI